MNELMADMKRNHKPVINLGFGEAGLPVLPSLKRIAGEYLGRNSYPYVQGGLNVRTAVSGYFRRRRIQADPALCLTAPGSKSIIFALLLAIQGDIILPKPSWTSYGMQAEIMGKKAVWMDIPKECGGIPDPALVQQAIDEDRANGGDPKLLLITNPDNPTGTVAPKKLIMQLAQIAKTNDLMIISDEIYRDLAYLQEDFVSIAEFAPERTVVTTGLSKSLALGGWRVGAAAFPNTDYGRKIYDDVVGIASEVWSGMAIFMEPVAEYAFSEPADVVERIRLSRALHSTVSNAVYQILLEAGASIRRPRGAFYLYPTFQDTDIAREYGVTTDAQLSSFLLSQKGIATLPGAAFGDDPSRMGLRVVTSMIYGDDDAQRERALNCDDPLSLEPIRRTLEGVRNAFHI